MKGSGRRGAAWIKEAEEEKDEEEMRRKGRSERGKLEECMARGFGLTGFCQSGLLLGRNRRRTVNVGESG